MSETEVAAETNNELKRYYTNAEFCEMMGIDPRTAWLWRKKGIIGFLQMPGGQIRYLAKHILEFEKRQEQKANSRGLTRAKPRPPQLRNAEPAHA